MKTTRAISFLLAALSASVVGVLLPGRCAAGAPTDYPGIAKGDKFLAAGPLPATLSFSVKKLSGKYTYEEKEVELLLLTEQFVIYRLKGKDAGGKLEKTPASGTTSSKIAIIKASDRPNKKTWTWELDAVTNRFTGSVREPEKIQIAAAAKFTPEQTNQFLFFTYQWMVDRLEDSVIFDEQELAKALIKKAERTADAMDQLGLDGNVEKLFRNMKLHHGDLIGVREELEKTLAGAANTNLELQQVRARIEMERRWIASTQTTIVGLNFLSLVLGGEGSLAPDPYLTRRSLVLLHRKLKNDAVERKEQDKTREKFQELSRKPAMLIQARKERDKVVCKKLGLPYLDWYSERSSDAVSKHDWPRVVERLMEIQTEYKKVTPHGDPWLQLEIYQTQSVVNYTRFDNDKLFLERTQQNAADRYKYALQMFDIVQQTPAENRFKEFRGDLIFKAAEACVVAAELELGEKATLRNAYNPKAVHALRLLNLAKNYDLEDVDRLVSEVKFRAMAHSLMHKEALEFGSQFSGARDTAKFHLTMAKLHLIFATDPKLEASKEFTKKAIKAGYYDFQALATNPDLKKVLSPDFIYENMAAEVSIRIVNSDKGVKVGKATQFVVKEFVLTNNSPFAVFNGAFSAGKITGWNATRFGKFPIIANTNFQKIEFLRPRESLVIPDNSNINNSFFAQQNPLFGFTVTNQGIPGFPVKAKLDR